MFQYRSLVLSLGLLPVCFGQGGGSTSGQSDLPRLGIAASIGSLGVGGQVATAVARKVNVRGGFNYFSYSLSGTTNDNIAYNGKLRLESAEALVDYYVAGPFHISGGALLYNGFQGTGTIVEPAGHSFTLNSVTYYSSPTDPTNGTGTLIPRKAAPVALIGFGNLLPRNKHHFTANFDLGVAFQGSPNAKLNLMGSVCSAPNTGCAPISVQPTVQANILAEQNKVNNDLAPFKFYPVLRLTFGYKF
jgi:hypothetical protein